MHRRAYMPDSVNRAITMNRAQLRNDNVRMRDRLARIEADKIAERERQSRETQKPSLFARIKKFMTQPISLGRRR